MYHFSRAIYRELADESSRTRQPSPSQSRTRPARVRGGGRAARHRSPLLRETCPHALQRHPLYFPCRPRNRCCGSSSATWRSPTSSCAASRGPASTSTATRCDAARARARAPRASGCRCRTTATARRTSTLPRPRTSTSSRTNWRPPELDRAHVFSANLRGYLEIPVNRHRIDFRLAKLSRARLSC